MNTKIIAVCAALVAAVSFADDEIEQDGGELRLMPKNHKTFLFVDAQSAVGNMPLKAVLGNIRCFMDFDCRTQKGTAPDLRNVPAALGTLGADGAIWIVDDPTLPISLSAVEDGWGVLNVAKLKDADVKKAERRVTCALLRLFASMFDVGDSTMMPGCVMRPASGVDGLDKLTCHEYSPEAASKVRSGLEAAGYKFAHVGTYYDACEQGWAPPPTNAVQKAIWEKVHKMPTNPIRILPESQRKK